MSKIARKDTGILQKTVRLENRGDGPGGDDRAEAGGMTGHITALGHEPHHYNDFLCGRGDVAAYLEKSQITRRENARSARGDSDRDICVDAGSRRQHRRALEGEEIN